MWVQYYRQIKIATTLKSLRKKNMIAVLTKFELNALCKCLALHVLSLIVAAAGIIVQS